ncbi:MAG: phosphodiesterase [Gemmatimonadetes bacterium SCN 70-22]|nr:MAG: phosphodiesterase [Gemmatimonadetes bacterium SCN 70-22]
MRRARKVIVIGLDGFAPDIVEPMLQRGELPHLERLRRMGGYARLATTTPAQTPVAWSTFATGVNPGGHGIFDFLRRDPATYLPDLSLSRYEQESAWLPPRAVNLRRGTPLWEDLADAGIPATVLRCPATYPPDRLAGRLLSGMGVPDIRGGLGTATILSEDPAARARESEVLVRLERAGERLHGHLVGPRHPRTRVDVTAPLTLTVDRGAGIATVETHGEPARLSVRLGEWSDWLQLTFRAGRLARVRATMRFLLVRTEPHVELYASPANFDPRAPLYPISHPAHYAAELARALGRPYYTTGMVEDHAGLSNGRFSEEAYLAQCEEVMRERETMMQFELARLRDGFFFVLFDTPDRVQHMFWRFREPGHPANGEDRARVRELAHVIEEHYRRCDRAVGMAMAAMDDETLFLVLSDHGFASFQRGLNLNNWLHEQGLLVLRGGAAPRASTPDFLREVDWGRTRAYALGLGSIYLNVAGRERDGIVPVTEAPALGGRIAAALSGLHDSARGAVAVLGGRTRAELYRGTYADESPDVVVDFNAGYRVSWATALGGFGDATFEDNTRKWGGDHIVSPALVPGVFFSNHRFDPADLAMIDMAPSILDTLGAAPRPVHEGRARFAHHCSRAAER